MILSANDSLRHGAAAVARSLVDALMPRPAYAFSVWTSALAFVLAGGLVAYVAASRTGSARLEDLTAHRLDVVAAGLDGELARFDYLPSLLEMNPSIARLIDAPADAGLRDEVNFYLHGINATAGATTLYVLNREGLCIAASDWNQPGTPLGADLSFRPYMREALATGRGRFYGVGITSGLAGYFMSYALQDHGHEHGVATVKISLDSTGRSWEKSPGSVLLLDERGVTILSSHADWKYRPLAALSQRVLDDIADARPYGKAGLVPLDWQVEQQLSADTAIANLGGTQVFAATRALRQAKWKLIVLEDMAPVQLAARHAGITAALTLSVLLLLASQQWQRHRALRCRLASQADLQSAHDALEARVAERTAEMVDANARLAGEVRTRKDVELHLRATQDELVHAGKMAVLGELSAGMVHEINQPLAAMRTLSDNACVLIMHGRFDEVRGNLQRIAQLTDRLGLVTSQLKVFAHKAPRPLAPASLQQAIANAHFLLAHRLRRSEVEMSASVQPPSLTALADDARLEQVLVNIIGNGIDAVAGGAVRRVYVEAVAAGERCVVTISDTGPGIRQDLLSRLFEPFVTSKPAGAGLGLGLMISAHIVREFGGSLRASNHGAGGARFVMELPLAAATFPEPAHG